MVIFLTCSNQYLCLLCLINRDVQYQWLTKVLLFSFLFYLGESNEDSAHSSYNADEAAHLPSQVTDEGYIIERVVTGNEEINRGNNMELETAVCPECFLAPCCTSYDNNFVGAGQPASNCNPAIRRVRYRKYWSVISNLGGWTKESYIAKKRRRTYEAGENVLHRREIMPKCVLNQLRNLYPNPDGQPYIGHKWE